MDESGERGHWQASDQLSLDKTSLESAEMQHMCPKHNYVMMQRKHVMFLNSSHVNLIVRLLVVSLFSLFSETSIN